MLPLCYIAQDEYGFLTERAMREVADILEMPYTDAFEVVTFYSLLYDTPAGKWMLQVCDDNPCCFTGAEELVADLEQRLDIRSRWHDIRWNVFVAARQVHRRLPSCAGDAGQSGVPIRYHA